MPDSYIFSTAMKACSKSVSIKAGLRPKNPSLGRLVLEEHHMHFTGHEAALFPGYLVRDYFSVGELKA